MTTSIIEYGTVSQLGPSLVQCQRNSFMRSFESIVTDCKEWSLPSAIDNKRKGKNKKSKKKKAEKFYEIELKDTILFPEGGGQPTDYGTLSIINDDTKINILSVHRTSEGRVLHKSNKKVSIGSKVNIDLEWKRRWDHMQQHSGQHLISAVFRNELKTPTISWWMSEYPKTSQIELKINKDESKESHGITADDIIRCENVINEIISDGRQMTVHVFHDKTSMETFATAHPKFKNKTLPDGAGPLRVVEIPDTEYNTCCGTHVRNTAQLQMIKITAWDVANDVLKVQFVAGNRIFVNYGVMYDRERQIGKLLSCGNDEYIANIDKMQKEIKNKSSLLRGIEKRLIELEIELLVNMLRNDDVFKGKRVKCIYEHFVNGNTKMLQGICNGVLNEFKESGDNVIVFIMFTMGVSTKTGQYIMATNDNKMLSSKNKQSKQTILSFIDGSGGGKPGRLQGKANNFKGYIQLFEYLNSLYPQQEKKEECKQQQNVHVLSMDAPIDALNGLDNIIDALDTR